jgi:hypothetical protein
MLALGLAASGHADPFVFSTGNPDGLMAMASRPDGGLTVETEAADDFVLAAPTSIDAGTFTGLLPTGASLSDVSQVRVEIYRVFPLDSDTGRTPNVPTRTNSPSDVELVDRDSVGGTLTYSATVFGTFTASNSVNDGIHPSPNQTTGGEGPVTGSEVQFTFAFSPALDLPAGHFFFVPQVLLSTSQPFFWLSAPRPIVAPGTPFVPDLQTWIRNADLAPDWLRVGTDIVGSGAFNGTFSLAGTSSGDDEPPLCKLVATLPGPPKQIQIEVQDGGAGLQTIDVTAAGNATVSVPGFLPGSTTPVLIVATKADQSKSSTVALSVTDSAGNVKTCDPRWPASRPSRGASRSHQKS